MVGKMILSNIPTTTMVLDLLVGCLENVKHLIPNGGLMVMCHHIHHTVLVGGFNPFEKYARQIGSFPQGSG